jgi:hypothetical protein
MACTFTCYDADESVSGDGLHADPAPGASGSPSAAATQSAFGRFRFGDRLATGRTGPLYRGHDLLSGDLVVIKRFEIRVGPERTRQLADDFGALTSRLPENPHSVRVLAGGLDQDHLTLVMSLVPGEGLDVALAEYGPAAMVDAVPRLEALARVLDDAAAQGIWHGALSPRDVVVSATGTSLTGLGIAQILESARVPIDARPPYTAPEASRDGGRGPRSDQFALAAIAHEWLFGAAVDGPADTPVVVPALPGVDRGRLADAFSTALASEPSARFESCGAFVTALQHAAPSLVVPDSPAAAPDLVMQQLRFDEAVEDAAGDAGLPALEAATVASFASSVDHAADTAGDSSSRQPLVALAAVFVAGLAIGSLGGYWFAARREPPIRASVADAEAPAAAAPVERREIVDEPIRPAPEPLAAPAQPAPRQTAAATAAASGGPARLLVRSTPAGATVIVDGAERGTTPLALREVPIGTRAIRLEHDGYEPVERRVVLSAERPSRSIDVALVRQRSAAIASDAATHGSLVIESRPPGAQVTIDGRVAGATPLTIARIAAGRHTVLITAPGWAPVTTTVDVKAGARARVAATLEGGRQDE